MFLQFNEQTMRFFLTFAIYSLMTMSGTLRAQGTVLESLTFKSQLLHSDVRYTIYLPPDYNTSERHYPVVYLLHGYIDDDTGWLQFGEANRIADDAIVKGEIPAMILVMPDGGLGRYVNDYQGKKPWADMFIKEFIPYIDATYQTRKDKQYRGISGLSMGGYGSLHMAMRNPDLFAACAAFSSGTRTPEEIINMPQSRYERIYGRFFGPGLKNNDRISNVWKAFNPLMLLESVPIEKLKSVRWYIDIGDDDFLYKGNSALHVKMRDMNIPHEYRVRDGAHNWSYWRSGLKDALAFIGVSFHQK